MDIRTLSKKLGLSITTVSRALGGYSDVSEKTRSRVEKFAKKGIKELAIATPAFVSDCLETLEEIGMEAAEDFEENGGKHLHVIPCINDRDEWVRVLSRWVDEWAFKESPK